jgi:fatty acid desaturase
VIRRFALGVWDFVVGDDWRIAVAVVLALGATALVAAIGIASWWVAPLAVLAVLVLSVRRSVNL